MGMHGSFGNDEILLIGDSNSYSGLLADGSAGFDAGIDIIHPRCLESRNVSGVAAQRYTQVALDPFQYNATNGIPPAGSIGPGLTAMRDWYVPNLLAADRNVRITTVGFGGTGFFGGFLCAPSTFTASISGTTMTVTGTPSSPLYRLMTVTGTGVTANTVINSQDTGSAGGAGNYTVTQSQNVASETMVTVVGGGLSAAVSRMNLSIAQDSRNVLKLILWCSGANDANNSNSGANYTSSFVAMAAYLRANLTGGSAVPILIQPLVAGYAGGTAAAINAAQAAMGSSVSKCGYVDPTAVGLSGHVTGQTGIPYHLTAEAQRVIGNPGFMNAYNSMSA